MHKKLIINILVIVAVALSILLFFVYKFYADTTNKKNKILNNETFSLVGKLTKIDNDKISIDVINEAQINNESKSATYEINVNQDTQIIRFLESIKSKEDFIKEQAQYEDIVNEYKSNNKNTFGILAPSWHSSEKILLKDLQKGNLVNVIANYNNGLYLAKYITYNSYKTEITEIEKKIDKIELEGVIKEIDEKNNIIRLDYFGEVKNIKYNKSSVFIKKIKKTENEFSQEQKDYEKAMTGVNANNLKAPDWFREENVNEKSLEIGQSVYIYGDFENGEYSLNKLEAF